MERFIEHTRKEVDMEKVTATRDFPGSTINRDELGLVEKGAELEVSLNDAAYLVREGYAERVEEEPAPAGTSASESSEAGSPASRSAESGRDSRGDEST